MWAVQLNSSGYVANYEYATLAAFAKNPRYRETSTDGSQWVFVDRTAFWSRDEVAAFMAKPSIYYYDPQEQSIFRDLNLE